MKIFNLSFFQENTKVSLITDPQVLKQNLLTNCFAPIRLSIFLDHVLLTSDMLDS